MHICHAHGCTKPVHPRMWGCQEHWFMLPPKLRDAVWHEYRSGQEKDKQPSPRYMAVQRLAVAHTAFIPNNASAAAVAGQYLAEAIMWQARAFKAGLGDPLQGLAMPGEQTYDA